MPLSPSRFSRPVTIFAVTTLSVVLLAACSKQSQSLADYISAICAAHFRDASRAEMPFLTENVSAMSKMMVDMGIYPSGDVDRDFVAMMVPHHQGAIEMAQAELRYGHNEQLRRMAQEIIVTQQQKIAAMRLAVGGNLPPAEPAPTGRLRSRRMPTPNSNNRERSCNMRRAMFVSPLSIAAVFALLSSASAGQAPGAASDPDIPVSHHDRVYAAEQFSNTVSVIDLADNKLLGVIRLGDPSPANFSPLYVGQLLVHGMGFSPDQSYDRRRLHRIEFRQLYRHGNQHGQARDLCRPLTA
jgi:Domain of unknown function (DUF305)